MQFSYLNALPLPRPAAGTEAATAKRKTRNEKQKLVIGSHAKRFHDLASYGAYSSIGKLKNGKPFNSSTRCTASWYAVRQRWELKVAEQAEGISRLPLACVHTRLACNRRQRNMHNYNGHINRSIHMYIVCIYIYICIVSSAYESLYRQTD